MYPNYRRDDMKKLKVFLGLFVSAFMIMPFMDVNAIYVDGIGYDGSNVTAKKEGNVWYLTLTGTAHQDLIIQNGEEVVLDLNGNTFVDYMDDSADNSPIWILDGGKLTIKDSKGNGVIKREKASKVPTVNNKGTLIVESGTISANGEYSSAIDNSGELTFNGGTVTTDAVKTFGLVNKGTAVINGGNFVQAYDFSIINNANKMEIKDGNFTIAEGNTNAYSLITNEGSANNATLEITGGTFKANKAVFFNEGEDTVTVSGGSYSHDVTEYLVDGFEMKLDENGEYVLVEESTTPENPKDETEEVKDEENNPKTSDGILLTICALTISGLVAIIAKKKLA